MLKPSDLRRQIPALRSQIAALKPQISALSTFEKEISEKIERDFKVSTTDHHLTQISDLRSLKAVPETAEDAYKRLSGYM